MANEKLTDKASFPGGGSAQATDLYHSVVVNDSTGSASGTSTKQTYQQLQDGVNLLTEINTIDPDADFIPIYDTSASATKKIHPQFAKIWSIGANQATNYTLVIGDSGGLVRMHKGTAINCTIPPNSSVAFPIGIEILVLQSLGGQVTIVAGSGVTIVKTSALTTTAQYAVVRLLKIASNIWSASGDLN